MNVDVIAERAESVLQHLIPMPSNALSVRPGLDTDTPEGAKTAPSMSSPSGVCDSERGRGSAFPNRISPANVVSFRAVEKFDKILPLAARFLAPGGRLALLIGSAQLPSLKMIDQLVWRSISVPKSQTRTLSIGLFRGGTESMDVPSLQ